MAAVLVILYIPCDNEDNSANCHTPVGGEDKSGQTTSKDIDRADQEGANTDVPTKTNPPLKSPRADDAGTLPCPIENGRIVLAQKEGIPEHKDLPLLDHAAESPVVGGAVVLRASPPVGGEARGRSPRRRVEFAEEGPGNSSDTCGEPLRADPAVGDDHVAGEKSETVVDSWRLEDALQDLLDKLPVDNDVWMKTDDDTVLQVSFVVAVEEVDVILRALTTFGLGSIPDTSISTFPASFHQAPKPKAPEEIEVKVDGTIKRITTDDSQSDFIRTIKSRLTVAQVVAVVEGNARATFDFIMLICLASFIAALGLVENSSVILVASMLISPLMGPILGAVFGFVIKNEKLTWLGIQNAFIGLVLCVMVGFLFGLVVSGVNYNGALWGSSNMWPTTEMASRGRTRSLWVGVLIALPSGAGVALSVLGGNVGSLVGVAISASLLPPAVNAGMLWAYGIITAIRPPEIVLKEASIDLPFTVPSSVNESMLNANTVTPSLSSPTSVLVQRNCLPLKDNAYQFVYSCTMADEAALLGVVSLLLTLLNILCIFIMGVIVLKIKEVAPHTTVSPVTEIFWKKDLPLARDCYKTLKGKDSLDAAKLAKDIARQWKEKHRGLDLKHLRKSWHYMLQDVYHSATIQDVAELQPTNSAPRRHTLLQSLSYQGHELDRGEPDDTPLSASFYTASMYSHSGESSHNHVRHRNPFFNRSYNFTSSPGYATPPTSDAARFNHLTVRSQKSRIPRRLQKQQSLTTEIEKAVMKNIPEKLGRFMVRTIEEGDEAAAKSPPNTETTAMGTPTARFILKRPVKKTASPPGLAPDSVLVNVEVEAKQPSTRERREQFFTNA